MKKNCIISLIISFITSVLLVGINYIYYLFNNRLLFSKVSSGGEIIQYYSFGLRLDHIVPLTNINEKVKSYSHLYFDLQSFIIMFIILFTLIFILSLIIKKIIKKK